MRNLFFWRGIEDAAFKRTDGGFIFYPYGALRAGYVVTDEQRAALAAHMRRFYLLSTIVILVQIVLGPIVGYLTALAVVVPALLLLFAYFHFGMRARIGSAPRAAERLGLGEAQRLAAQTMSNGRVATILVLGALLVAGSLFLFFLGMRQNDGEATLLGGLSAVFFGLLFLIGCYNAWLKWGRQPQ